MLSTRAHNLLCAGVVAGGFALALAIAVVGNRSLTPFELIAARIAAAALLFAFALLILEHFRPRLGFRLRRGPSARPEINDHGL